ncbi:MAG: phosphoglycolate phosphatase [Rhodovibrionaceae bacterium]
MAGLGQKKNVLLADLDGTLVDSAPDLAAAANKLLVELGSEALPLERIRGMIGDGMPALVERALTAREIAFGPEFLPGAVARMKAFYAQDIAVETRPYPGVRRALEALRAAGWRLAVCTNKPEKLSHALLQALQLDGLFAAVAGGDSYAERKPAAGHPLRLLEALGAPPEQAVLLGDGPNDILAARAAGIDEIWFSGGYGGGAAEARAPRRRIDGFAELAPLLERL